MTELDPKNSVRKELLGDTEDTKNETAQTDNQKETSENKMVEEQPDESEKEPEVKELKDEISEPVDHSENDEQTTVSSDNSGTEVKNEINLSESVNEKVKTEEELSETNKASEGEETGKPEEEEEQDITATEGEEKLKEADTSKIHTGEISEEEKLPVETDNEEVLASNIETSKEEESEEILSKPDEDQPSAVEKPERVDESDESNIPVDKVQEKEESKEIEQETLPALKDINYTIYSKEELVDTLRRYISEYPLERIKNHVETIRSVFYKIHNDEIETIHKKFIEEGGKEEDFKVEDSPVEINMKELINIYREKRNEQSKSIEEQKEINLQAKYDIIDAIKELINSQESLNKTFHDFRGLQESWREIGPVPQKNLKDLWESYHYHVEAFYDYIKINKELRDLDFKKNLDAKLLLCEKAEELLLETSVVEAFRNLQVLHDQWREIGPVPADKRSEIWERFRDATSKINRRHQEYFVSLKEEQKKNLQEKTALCEKAEEIAVLEIDNAKDWEARSKELIDIQKVWKTIGFAPKKHNTKIYERFRAACDSFFDKKREYFASNREEQENNLQLKTELCIQAEALKDSTDWKKTTDELIKLQKRWKSIGPVPIKQSDKIWKRFRAACDTFFNNKSKFYENIDTKYEDNLKAKEELIQKIETFELSSDVNKNLDQLKTFQRDWAEIGFVPIKMKDEIQEKYREAINNKFDQLKIDDEKKSLLKFRSRIESIVSKPNADRRLSMERDKCYNKLKQLENDITLWENNIGFFSNSKNAESMITDVERKIEAAKEKIEILQEKINIIDEFD